MWEYQISQEFEGNKKSEWQLLETGELTTLEDAAATINSIKICLVQYSRTGFKER